MTALTTRRIKAGPILLHGFLWLVVLWTLGPVVYTFLTSIKYFRDIVSGSFAFEPTFANYEELFTGSRSNFYQLTINSLIVAFGSLLVVLFITSLAAYSLSRFKWRLIYSALIMSWVLFVNMLPPIIFIGPFYLIAQTLGIYDTPLAVIMAHTVLNLPLAFWMLHSYFSDVPAELEEAAAIDGCNRLMTFWRIVLPLTKPGIAATAVLVFVFSWKDFLFALVLSSTPRGMTIPVGIASFIQEYNIRYGEMAAAAFFATIPALILVIVAQKHIVKGLTLGALKG
ncbi:MAG: carbohydrate ABC transporter permease [Anaerolineae bacterium]|nr:carbohydrate ABC transporter permease [Anaerolineae bacterium]